MLARITTIILTLGMIVAYAQSPNTPKIMVDIESNMQVKFGFKDQMLINRLQKTQVTQVAEGSMTEKESYCISVNSLAVLHEDAQTFVDLAEKKNNKIELTLLEKEEANRISRLYFEKLILVTNKCSKVYGISAQNTQKQDTTKK